MKCLLQFEGTMRDYGTTQTGPAMKMLEHLRCTKILLMSLLVLSMCLPVSANAQADNSGHQEVIGEVVLA